MDVGQHLHAQGQRRRLAQRAGREAAVGGGEGEQEVAAPVLAHAARAGDPERRPLGEAGALRGQQRRVRGHEDDDRARARRPELRDGHLLGRDGRAHRRPVDRQAVAPPVVGLDEHADRVAPDAGSTTREAVPRPPLNSWQIIPVPLPALPSATGPPAAAA